MSHVSLVSHNLKNFRFLKYLRYLSPLKYNQSFGYLLGISDMLYDGDIQDIQVSMH